MKTRLPKLAPPEIKLSHCNDGSFILESAQKLQTYDRCIGVWLDKWSQERPDQTFLAQKINGKWETLSYREVRKKIGQIAQGLLERGLTGEKPIAILSENTIDHALLSLAAMHVGIPVATISSAYSTMTEDCERLLNIIEALEPALIYADSGVRYANALNKLPSEGIKVVSKENEHIKDGTLFNDLFSDESNAVSEAFQKITPDTHARYLLTSGSTGTPKVVINTQRMLCANQQQISQIWGFVEDTKLKVLDWLPWSHTFGANHNFNLMLRNGGEYYIDDGKPMPGAIEKTIENIKEVRPNLIFNVPRGYEVLVSYMEKDKELQEALFKDLILVFYAAAALPMATWNRMREMAFEIRGDLPFFTSSWGATETAPAITNIHFNMDNTSNLGLPLPGLSIKFVPSGDKFEMRVKGPSIFPGYRRNDQKSAEAFDEDGYYLIEDAGKLIDPSKPERGIAFDGRVTEDFKLTTGTWVSVGTMRPALVSAFAPYIQDFIICGHNEDYVAALAFVSPSLKEMAGEQANSLPPHRWTEIPSVRKLLESRMSAFKAENSGSSQHIKALILLDTPPNPTTGEITDKGYLNQRACLKERILSVKELYEKKSLHILSI